MRSPDTSGATLDLAKLLGTPTNALGQRFVTVIYICITNNALQLPILCLL